MKTYLFSIDGVQYWKAFINHCLVVVGVGFLFIGCSAAMGTHQMDLPEIVERFLHDFRWQYHQEAISKVDPSYSSALLEQWEKEGKDLNVTGWDLRSVELSPNKEMATVRVQYEYYKMPSMVLKQETAIQTWKKINGCWFLTAQENGPFVLPLPDDKKSTAPNHNKDTGHMERK